MAKDKSDLLTKNISCKTKVQTAKDMNKISNIQKKSFNAVLNAAMEEYINRYRVLGLL